MREDGLILFQCRCGRTRVRSYLTPPPCMGCWHCRTNLTLQGLFSVRKLPHETYSEDMVLSEDGELRCTVEICKWCGMLDDRRAFHSVIV